MNRPAMLCVCALYFAVAWVQSWPVTAWPVRGERDNAPCLWPADLSTASLLQDMSAGEGLQADGDNFPAITGERWSLGQGLGGRQAACLSVASNQDMAATGEVGRVGQRVLENGLTET